MVLAVQVSSCDEHSSMRLTIASANGEYSSLVACLSSAAPQGYASKSFTVRAAAETTVAELKLETKAVCKVATDEQRIIFSGRQLRDCHTLLQCGVSSQATLQLLHRSALAASPVADSAVEPQADVCPRLRGGRADSVGDALGEGCSFVDVDNAASLKRVQLVPYKYKWRVVKPGLNVYGTCRNTACAAHKSGMQTIHALGHVTFVLTHSAVHCPECGTQFQPETCGVYNTSVSPHTLAVVGCAGWVAVGTLTLRCRRSDCSVWPSARSSARAPPASRAPVSTFHAANMCSKLGCVQLSSLLAVACWWQQATPSQMCGSFPQTRSSALRYPASYWGQLSSAFAFCLGAAASCSRVSPGSLVPSCTLEPEPSSSS